MVKKVTMFISPPVRRKMETDGYFRKSPGLIAALLLVGEAVVRAACKPYIYSGAENSPSDDCRFPGLRKHLSEHWGENTQLCNAFSTAARAEATITFLDPSHLMTTIYFYSRNRKSCFWFWEVSFCINDGVVSSDTRGTSPTN